MTFDRLVRALAMASSAICLASCSLNYGAGFDYHSEPPVPPGASIIAKAEGADSDDPMRGREVVIDTSPVSSAETVALYREQYSATEGWLDGTHDPDVGVGHLLCLASRTNEDFDEYVEIYPYEIGFASAGQHRYLVSISRLHVVPGDKRDRDRCGQASIWYPTDL